MKRVGLWAIALVLVIPSIVSTSEFDPVADVRELRLGGELDEAQTLAETALENSSGDPVLEVELRIELARIHDRHGLHNNTRPVAAALDQIEAAAIAAGADPRLVARVELARADYHYRAEMSGGEFPEAIEHAERAIKMFRELGDGHSEAEAVHRRGLIHMQRRELKRARKSFDDSMELDIASGERAFFRGEFERHIGFVDLLEGDTPASVPHFERSLAARRRAGAIDASLFAAVTLASALVEVGRVEDAKPHLLYAMMVGEKLGSPTGKARAGLVLGRVHAHDGDTEAARIAYEMTLALAESIKSSSIASQARDALAAL